MRRIRWSRRRLSWLSLALAVFFIIGQHYGWFDKLSDTFIKSDPGLYTIVHYNDGDTIIVNMNGTRETIRFIGVDTPETHKPNTPVQCGGPEAAAYTKTNLQLFGKVRLQADPFSSNRDRYGRLLRYVYLPNGTLWNENLITNGYGFAYTYFPFTKSALFTKDGEEAKNAKRGAWSHCTPQPNQYGGYTSNDI
jgi:endonuclease YncB( thermonuclease family)